MATAQASSIIATRRERFAVSNVSLAIFGIVLGLFVMSAYVNAERKSVLQGFDELAHASYIADLQAHDRLWLPLEDLRMLDPKSFHFTSKANYLNHPPIFYALLAKLGPALEGNPRAIFVHRVLNVAFAAFGLAVLLALGLMAGLRQRELYAYIVPMACIPVLAPLAGSINNDNLAFTGGGIAILASWQFLVSGRASWLAAMLLGAILAAWAKLTGALLVGGFVTIVVAYQIFIGQMRLTWIPVIAAAILLAAAPYLVLMVHYGSPAPDTPAQLALLRDGAQIAGWDAQPRLGIFAYIWHFITNFVAGWMPTLSPRSTIHFAMLAIPASALLCALAGAAISARRVLQGNSAPIDVITVAGAISLVATFAVNVVYSYDRHLTAGWMMDAYPRYYLPLAVIVPLAGLVLLSAIGDNRLRKAILLFLISGPFVFAMFGAPLSP